MVTGGLGGLGLRAASLLLSGGASRLVLSSRSGRVARDGQGLSERLRALATSASGVAILACDGGAPNLPFPKPGLPLRPSLP